MRRGPAQYLLRLPVGGWQEMTLFDVELVIAVFAIAAVITYWVAARSRS
jgi:hypothetical protein